MQVVTQSDSHKEMNEYMEKYKSIHSFSVSGPCILEREHLRKSKIIVRIKRFKFLSKGDNCRFA